MKRRHTAFGILALTLGSSFPQLVSADPLPNAWVITDSSGVTGSTLNYTNTLAAPQHFAATNVTGGFRFSVTARLADYYDDNSKTMNMSYGMGTTNRFLIWWDLDNNDDLTAELEGGPTFTITSGGTGRALYHTHEIIYNPTNETASYRVDGQVKTNGWKASTNAATAGRISWGAGSSSGKGQMNFHSVTFTVTNTVVASYNAGSNGIPAAPNPTTQGWTLVPAVPPAGTSITDFSPDSAVLPVATTLAADQLTNSSARLNGQFIGRDLPTMAWFEWGTDTNYGNVTPAQDAGQGLSLLSVSAVLAGLASGPVYHCRVVVSNSYEVVHGTNQSFNLSFLPATIPNLPGVQFGSVAWGDYDNDGRLDFLLTGSGISQLWRNTGSGFSNVTASVAISLPGVSSSSMAWGDYDNNGRLDFLLTGLTAQGISSKVWRSTSNGFEIAVSFSVPESVERSSVAWGDFDNDGRLDFLLTGNNPIEGPKAKLLRNTGNGFSDVTASVTPGLPGVDNSSVAWGDYDNDGRLDFLLTGDAGSTNVSQLWRNTGSGFTNVPIPNLPGVLNGSAVWGDYDNDGRLDFLLTGQIFGGTNISQIWWNTGSGFSNVTTSVAPGLPGVGSSFVAWGDFDNDGRLDFLLAGQKIGTGVGPYSQLWRNTGSGFTNATPNSLGLPGVSSSFVAWGDHDNDGRLDFLLTGFAGSTNVSQLWRNNLSVPSNAPPAAPTGLSAIVSGNTVTLNWNASLDDLTPAAGLNYNVRIGSAPGTSDVLAPMALTNGFRNLPALGNARTNAFYQLPAGNYYWSVQAVDTSFAGSPFAAEQQFTIAAPLRINPVHYSSGVFEFYFTNPSMLNFEVLASTNAALPMVAWTNLGPAVSLGGGLYRFTDTLAPDSAQRFYLLRKQ